MKRILAFLISFTMILSIAACGSSQQPSSPSASADGGDSRPKEIETTFWTDFLVDEKVFTDAIAEFTAKYPQYTVNFEK